MPHPMSAGRQPAETIPLLLPEWSWDAPQKGGDTMPDKEKVKEVQALVDKLDTLPETAKQRILGIAEGIEMANKAAEEKKGA